MAGRYQLDLSSGFKTCPKCEVSKPLTDFGKSKNTLHGYQVYCKVCSSARHDEWRRKNMAHCAAEQKRHRDANPERHREYGRKANYGLQPGVYAQMLAAQNGKCAICATDRAGGKGAFHVDHCHNSLTIRGLLCHHCNLGIGHLQHRIEVLEAATRYLNQNSN